MPESGGPVHVAINVMRARITLVGFNIAIITFQLVELRVLSGAVDLPGLGKPVHLAAAAALFMGLALSFVSMVAYIASSAFDQQGTCTHWSLIAGDVLMYAALAQTVSGFFGPFLGELQDVGLSDPKQSSAFGILYGAISLGGGVAWVMAMYAGPLVSLLRSPFPRWTTAVLAAGYLLLLVAISVVETGALRLNAELQGGDGDTFSWLGGLASPLRW